MIFSELAFLLQVFCEVFLLSRHVLRGNTFRNNCFTSPFSPLLGNTDSEIIRYIECHPHLTARELTKIILNIRSSILDLFEVIEEELLQQDLGYGWSGIRSRLHSLDEFEGVYNKDLGEKRSDHTMRTPYVRPSEMCEKPSCCICCFPADSAECK